MEIELINPHLEKAEKILKKIFTYIGIALVVVVVFILYTTPFVSSVMMWALAHPSTESDYCKFTHDVYEKYPLVHITSAVALWFIHAFVQYHIGFWWKWW